MLKLLLVQVMWTSFLIVAQGFARTCQCKGTDDWKTRLDSEKLEDYDYVLQIANETVYKNGGKPLGDEILKIGEAGFHLDMQDSDRSLMSC